VFPSASGTAFCNTPKAQGKEQIIRKVQPEPWFEDTVFEFEIHTIGYNPLARLFRKVKEPEVESNLKAEALPAPGIWVFSRLFLPKLPGLFHLP
jgi:hypothetical protein